MHREKHLRNYWQSEPDERDDMLSISQATCEWCGAMPASQDSDYCDECRPHATPYVVIATTGNRKKLIREKLLQLVQANRAASDQAEKAWCKVWFDFSGYSATRSEIGHLLEPIEDRIHALAVQMAGLQFRLSLVHD